MPEPRPKGWHADPFGRFHQRFYDADDQPGRLVRDASGNESYDDLPELEGVAPGQGPTEDADSPLWEPVQAPSPRAGSDALFDETPGGPMFDDEPIRWRTTVAARLEALKLPKVTMHMPTRTGKPLGRRAWLTMGVVGALVVAAVALALSLSGPSKPSAVATSTTTTKTKLPTLPSKTSAWRVAEAFEHTAVAITGVSCPNSTDCFAVGETSLLTGLILNSIDSGSTWHEQSVPSSVGPLSAVSCATGSSCVAVGGTSVLSTIDGGATWSAQNLGTGQLTAVGCPTPSTCIAAGTAAAGSGCTQGEAYTTADGGAEWSTRSLVCFVPSGIACPDVGHCQLAGVDDLTAAGAAQVDATVDGGLSWSSEYLSTTSGTKLNAISCPSTKFCTAVGRVGGSSILSSSDGGHTWAPQMVPASAQSAALTAVSCESNLVCQAVGSLGLATDNGGSSWSADQFPSVVTSVDAVSCPLVTSCIAGGTQDPFAVILSYV
jgi:photosystem II stability/assembly factor-like uncharacterized protein